MSILVDSVRISGFRGLKNLEMSFSKITVLLGMNNSGKTSILKALSLALGDYARHLCEEDFYIGNKDKRSKEILVDIKIIPLGEDKIKTQFFSEEWQEEFGDRIKSDLNGYQYLAIRTCSRPDAIKGGYSTNRATLEKWPNFKVWNTERIKETKLSSNYHSIPFISVEAQRDIHKDLNERNSWVGKILGCIEYNEDDIETLESLIEEVNTSAVDKSPELTNLKSSLEKLNQSFEGSGKAEITPVPRKVRDFSKYFSINFGEDAKNIFPMEYHGMGTRSWASMLTVSAFIELMLPKHEKEAKMFFPILAAEEPEAHLHPNAQKTLYRQLEGFYGQVIISTHSPYLAAMADQKDLRYLKSSSKGIVARKLSNDLEDNDRRRLQREVIHTRGEIIFSKVLVLCEGETEEQALPLLFSKYFENEPFVLGVSFIGVGGSGKYLPFLSFSRDFSIPIFIFSDGEEQTIKTVKRAFRTVYGENDTTVENSTIFLDDTDFEGYLLASGFQYIIEESIKELKGEDYINYWIRKNHGKSYGRTKTGSPPCPKCNQFIFSDVLRDYQTSNGYGKAMIDILDKNKAMYAPAIADKLCDLEVDKFPEKIIQLFEKIKLKL